MSQVWRLPICQDCQGSALQPVDFGATVCSLSQARGNGDFLRFFEPKTQQFCILRQEYGVSEVQLCLHMLNDHPCDSHPICRVPSPIFLVLVPNDIPIRSIHYDYINHISLTKSYIINHSDSEKIYHDRD